MFKIDIHKTREEKRRDSLDESSVSSEFIEFFAWGITIMALAYLFFRILFF